MGEWDVVQVEVGEGGGRQGAVLLLRYLLLVLNEEGKDCPAAVTGRQEFVRAALPKEQAPRLIVFAGKVCSATSAICDNGTALVWTG